MTNSQTPSPRFFVHDSLASTSSHLVTAAAKRTRYWILDSSTGLAVDEYASKRAATSAARELNAAEPDLDGPVDVAAAELARDEIRTQVRSMMSLRNPRGAYLKRQLRDAESHLSTVRESALRSVMAENPDGNDRPTAALILDARVAAAHRGADARQQPQRIDGPQLGEPLDEWRRRNV